MVDVYITLIIAGRREFKNVPAFLKERVREDLVAMGLEELCVE